MPTPEWIAGLVALAVLPMTWQAVQGISAHMGLVNA
jgi:hypothetical protein